MPIAPFRESRAPAAVGGTAIYTEKRTSARKMPSRNRPPFANSLKEPPMPRRPLPLLVLIAVAATASCAGPEPEAAAETAIRNILSEDVRKARSVWRSPRRRAVDASTTAPLLT